MLWNADPCCSLSRALAAATSSTCRYDSAAAATKIDVLAKIEAGEMTLETALRILDPKLKSTQ